MREREKKSDRKRKQHKERWDEEKSFAKIMQV